MTEVGVTMLAGQVDRWAGESAAALRRRWERDAVYPFDSIPSTNDFARGLAAAGAPAGSIVVCREQTAGRGRRGRAWSSPAGAGLYLSMLFRPGADIPSPLLTVVAGVDLARELNRRFPGLGAAVKWPNDLMAGDRKLGGILAEVTSGGEGEGLLIVGVGINVEAGRLPADVKGAVALDERVGPARLIDVADAAVAGLERRLPTVPDVLDAASLDELDRFDWLRHRWVEHRLSDRKPAVGLAAGIAPDGALLLRPRGEALRRVVAGSIEVGGS
ncbi:biotin--[acetyl-CoA-carboxylase] ligase [Candidatus Palauibacter sp.]|uniref:biotin--[acetyl-CoA-carboxylase] ligase n=1 Tax=Candidatus Palauibacter sp. TaxID=3101350 RepID=UPI003B0103D8